VRAHLGDGVAGRAAPVAGAAGLPGQRPGQGAIFDARGGQPAQVRAEPGLDALGRPPGPGHLGVRTRPREDQVIQVPGVGDVLGPQVELGSDHPGTLSTLSDIAVMYQRQGKYALAETYAAQTMAGRSHSSGKEDPDTLAAEADLALAYQSQGKFAESGPLAREVMEIEQKQQPDDWQRFRAETLLGASLVGQRKYAEAEPLLLEGYRGMSAQKGRIAVPDWYHLDRARDWIVELYTAWGKSEKATKWKHKQN